MDYSRRDPYLQSRYEQGVDAKIVIMGNTGGLSFSAPTEVYPVEEDGEHLNFDVVFLNA